MSAQPMHLSVIRKWPEGFEQRLQHVWIDVVSFIPNVKLYDLQRVLAEFGFRMEVYEDGGPWVSVNDQLPEQREKPYQCLAIARKKYSDTSNYPGEGVRTVAQDWVLRKWPENFECWMQIPALSQATQS